MRTMALGAVLVASDNDLSAGTTMAEAPSFEIVGVVSDTRNVGPGLPPMPQVYVPYTAAGSAPETLFVRSPATPESLLKALRGVINEFDKDLPIDGAPLRDELYKACFLAPRYRMTMLALFAALGLALIGTGVYSVLSYSVSCRTHEFGVRMALGANPADVYWAVLKSGLRWLASGIAIGIPTSIALGRAFESWLFGMTAANPLALSAVSVALTAVGLAACYFPARGATKVDPMQALRFE